MRRQDAKQQRRAAAFRPSVQEVDIPLPLGGLFTQARSGRVSNLYAAEMLNMRSNRVNIGMRPAVEWEGEASTVVKRIPYEFGTSPDWIEVDEAEVRFGAVTYARAFNPAMTWAAISSNVIIADGFGQPLRFDGSSFAPCAFTISTGENPIRLSGVVSHHDRLFLWRRGKLEFYYGDVGAVTGPLDRFPLDRLGNIRGSIVAMLSMTVDAGHGMNDMLCIVTSAGQLVLYEGLDPGDVEDWRLNAIIQAAAPLGEGAFAEVGADVWMLTAQGIVSLGEAIRSSTLALVSDMTAPVSARVAELADPDATWTMHAAIDGSMIVVNRVLGTEAAQLIYYTASKSWAEADIPAREWHSIAGAVSITGTDGRFGAIAHTGGTEAITARLVTSWFETGRQLGISYLLPTIRATGPLTVRVVVLSDTNDTAADVAEAEQTITIEPEEDGDIVTLAEEIGCDAVGSRFQITLEVTATWMELISLKAAVG